jgi:hypothetical protein
MCEECEIGIWYDFNEDRLITFKELNELYEQTVYTRQDYYDRRKSTNLLRFNFCPICGEKIIWE